MWAGLGSGISMDIWGFRFVFPARVSRMLLMRWTPTCQFLSTSVQVSSEVSRTGRRSLRCTIHQPQHQSSNFMPRRCPLQHFPQSPQDSRCRVGWGVLEFAPVQRGSTDLERTRPLPGPGWEAGGGAFCGGLRAGCCLYVDSHLQFYLTFPVLRPATWMC